MALSVPVIFTVSFGLACALGGHHQPVEDPIIDGKPLGTWVDQLKSGDAMQRRLAALKLSLRATPECASAIPALIDSLKDGEQQVVTNACRALGKIGPEAKTAVPHLLEAVAADRLQSGQASTTLKNIGPDARPALSKALSHKNEKVRKLAAATLSSLGPAEGKSSVADLTRALRDKDYGIRRNALAALARLGSEAKAAAPEIVRLLRGDLDADDAAKTLAAIGTPAVPSLRLALRDKDERLRLNAAMTLGLFKQDAKTVHPLLLERFHNDDSSEVQGMAARSLGRLRHEPTALILAFRNAVASGNPYITVRLGIADGIANLGESGRAGMDILVVEAITSQRDFSYLRSRCLRAIGETGIDAKIDEQKGTVDFRARYRSPDFILAPPGTSRTRITIQPDHLYQPHREAFKLLLDDTKSSNEDCRKAALESLKKIDADGKIAKAYAK